MVMDAARLPGCLCPLAVPAAGEGQLSTLVLALPVPWGILWVPDPSPVGQSSRNTNRSCEKHPHWRLGTVLVDLCPQHVQINLFIFNFKNLLLDGISLNAVLIVFPELTN